MSDANVAALISAVQTLITAQGAADDGIRVSVNTITLFYDGATAVKDNLSISKYFTKVQPSLSLVRNSDNELVVKITNPSDSAKSFTIVWYKASWEVSSASLNGQNIGTWTNVQILAGRQVTLSKWTNTELRLWIAKAWTVKLTGITIQVEDSKNTFTYVIDDNYTNVAT